MNNDTKEISIVLFLFLVIFFFFYTCLKLGARVEVQQNRINELTKFERAR